MFLIGMEQRCGCRKNVGNSCDTLIAIMNGAVGWSSQEDSASVYEVAINWDLFKIVANSYIEVEQNRIIWRKSQRLYFPGGCVFYCKQMVGGCL